MIFCYGRQGKHAWKKGHAWKEIDRCCDHWKDGRRSLEGSVVVLYILIRSRRRSRELGAIECCRVVSMRAEKFFLPSSLCVGDRTLHCRFDLWWFVLYEPVAPPMYQCFAIII